MNFGVKIVILYLSFVALILTLVFLSFGEKVDLVSKDYYAQELNYQEKIDAMNNANSLEQSIDHAVEKSGILLTINPELQSDDFTGNVLFYRPSDSGKDRKFNLQFKNNQQLIPKTDLESGMYKIQLSWKTKGKTYFKEEVIFLQ